jgi:hypothetical protein
MKMCDNALRVDTLQIAVFYDMMACSLEDCYCVLENLLPTTSGWKKLKMFLKNGSSDLADYTMSFPEDSNLHKIQ